MTDLEGSTRLWERFPVAMDAAMREHDQLANKIVGEHDGRIVKARGEGDSLFATFGSAERALSAAISLQEALGYRDWGELGSLFVRISLHSGEAEFRDDDYYGPSVNRCARMRAAAHGGQTVLSEAVAHQVGATLPEQCRLVSLGKHRFRDLREPETVYQVVVEGLRSDFPPLKSIDSNKNNLPLQLSSFIGRDKELERLYNLVSRNRLVTLTGAGGSGKTRLSIQCAGEFAGEYDGGVWFVPLADLRESSLIAQQIADELPLLVQDRDPLEALIEEFRNQELLVVIDNCEHLDKAVAPVVNKLLRSCSRMKIIATSREPLSVVGEALFVVPPLACELFDKEPTLENVAKLEAVTLLRDRAASRNGGVEILNEATAPTIYALVNKLSGIPLAIEQVASAMAYLSPKQALDQVTEHIAGFSLPDEGVDERHKTMQATIDWSYVRLPQSEQLLFQQFAVFDGGATADAVEFLCGTGKGFAVPSLMLLGKLTQCSLLVAEDTAWGEKRFRILEPIREYALSKQDHLEGARLCSRHFEWHSMLVEQAAKSGLDARDGYYMKRLVAESNNIRTALEWASRQPDGGVPFLQTCVALYDFWVRQSMLREGATWFQKAMDAALGAPTELKADALNKMGALMYLLGKIPQAENAFMASLELWRELRNEVKIAAGTNNLALIASQQGRHEDALVLFQEAMSLFEAAGGRRKLADCLQNYAVSLEILGRLDSAASSFERALSILKEDKDQAGQVQVIQNCLGVYWQQGRLAEEAWLLEEGLQLLLSLKEKQATKGMLEIAAAWAFELERPEAAAELLGAAAKAGEQAQTATDERSERFRVALETKIIESIGRGPYNKLYKAGQALGTQESLKKALRLFDVA